MSTETAKKYAPTAGVSAITSVVIALFFQFALVGPERDRLMRENEARLVRLETQSAAAENDTTKGLASLEKLIDQRLRGLETELASLRQEVRRGGDMHQ